MRCFHNTLAAVALYVVDLLNPNRGDILFLIVEGTGDQLAESEGINNVAGSLGVTARHKIPSVV